MAGKVSDGKSVEVLAPVGGVEGGKFYLIDGFLGCAFATRDAGEGVALNIEQGEFETSQVNETDTFAKGVKIYWNDTAKEFTESADDGVGGDYVYAGKVTVAKDANGVIWFIQAPQI